MVQVGLEVRKMGSDERRKGRGAREAKQLFYNVARPALFGKAKAWSAQLIMFTSSWLPILVSLSKEGGTARPNAEAVGKLLTTTI
ncbi:MAG TPA: hypothetical protein VGO47_04380 [Chlamydiales bacterium]|nr:hypothetical protein [Chlamydiales bacterium]